MGKKACISRKKSLRLISPLHFNSESIFYYTVKNFSFFEKYTKDLNLFKPDKKETKMLDDIIINKSKEVDLNKNLVFYREISPLFIDKILALKPVPLLSNNINNNILDIIKEIGQKSSISIQKIIDLYKKSLVLF